MTTPLAELYARTNFAVPTRKTVQGVRLEASDGPFVAGEGRSSGARRSR